MSEPLAGPPSATLERLISDEGMEFTPFSRALNGIAWPVASARPGGSPHSIADILGHMRFWQRRLLGLTADGEPRPVGHAEEGWPHVEEAQWNGLVDSYLAGLAELRAVAGDPALLARRVVEGRDTSVGYQLTSHFAHEAHHLGQIILLRRMQGDWPPAGGGDTW
ncbi:MAG TPA: DinB family protein [Trueperaceae bacterium]